MASDHMKKALQDFPKQFAFQPEIRNAEKLLRKQHSAVVGMGGSQLAADILRAWKPALSLRNHRDYGLPAMSDHEAQHTLFIASSYSGNTEETISGYEEAHRRRLALAVIAVGGKLIGMAVRDGVPYIQMPDTGIQPRAALGYNLMSLLCLLGEQEGMAEASALAHSLRAEAFEPAGKELAMRLRGHVPVIYASTRNGSVAYNWKIKFNETGKIPAFCNVVPELNHNEMTGFDVQQTTRPLVAPFHWVFLRDASDHPQVQKRMEVLRQLYTDRGLSAEQVHLEGATTFGKIFASLLTADWCAYHTAAQYGLEAEQVPMVEEFKKRIA